MNGRGARGHRHIILLCNHTYKQTRRGVRTFVQCNKPKQIVVLEGDENCCKHQIAMLGSKEGAQIQLDRL